MEYSQILLVIGLICRREQRPKARFPLSNFAAANEKFRHRKILVVSRFSRRVEKGSCKFSTTKAAE